MSERIVPVVSEAEIAPGMLVVLVGCRYCGSRHRFMLLRKTRGLCRWDGEIRTGWRVAPNHHAEAGKGVYLAEVIVEGRLFRVDLGLEAAMRLTFRRVEA